MLSRRSNFDSFIKKDTRTEKANYRPISLLLNISKACERCLYEQIYSYFKKMFSKYLTHMFNEGINQQHVLLAMIEKMNILQDKQQFYAAILTDFSKAFD